LRGKKEIERRVKNDNYYNNDIKEGYVKNIPIEPNLGSPPPDNPSKHFYIRFLEVFQEEIKIIFEEYFSKAAFNKLIIHCEGGKDRTGIIIAILLDLLGVSRKLIIEDYLLSFKDTKSYYIESTLGVLDKEYGGAKNYLLNHCGVSEKAIENIIKTFIEKVNS